MINWTYVVIAFSAGGLCGMLLMSWLAMSGRHADQEWHEIEKKEAYKKGYWQGKRDEIMRRGMLFGESKNV